MTISSINIKSILKHGTLLNGITFVSISHAGFILSGYCVNVFLARILGPDDYGTYGVVISIVVWMESILTVGLLTALYKTVSEQPKSTLFITKRFSRYLLGLSISLLGIVTMTSGTAAMILGDSRIAFFLSIASIDLIFASLHRLLLAVQSGLRRFHDHAYIQLVYSVTKAIAIIAPVWWGFGVLGGLIGNIIASVAAMIAGFYLFRRVANAATWETATLFDFKKILGTVPAISLGYIGCTLYTSADLWMVKAYAGATLSGHYLAALNIAKLFLMATLPLQTVIMPFVAGAVSEGNIHEATNSIRKIFTLFFLMTIPAICIIFFFSHLLMQHLYSELYLSGAAFLRVLAVGYVFVSLAQTLNVILISFNRSWFAGGFGLGFGLISLPLYFWSVQTFGPLGAAYTLTGVSAVNVICSAVIIRRTCLS